MLKHQTLPPGAYIIEFKRFDGIREAKNGEEFMRFVISVVGTTWKDYYHLASSRPWQELGLNLSWLGLSHALIKRKFLVEVGRINIHATQSNQWFNSYGWLLCEVTD